MEQSPSVRTQGQQVGQRRRWPLNLLRPMYSQDRSLLHTHYVNDCFRQFGPKSPTSRCRLQITAQKAVMPPKTGHSVRGCHARPVFLYDRPGQTRLPEMNIGKQAQARPADSKRL